MSEFGPSSRHFDEIREHVRQTLPFSDSLAQLSLAVKLVCERLDDYADRIGRLEDRALRSAGAASGSIGVPGSPAERRYVARAAIDQMLDYIESHQDAKYMERCWRHVQTFYEGPLSPKIDIDDESHKRADSHAVIERQPCTKPGCLQYHEAGYDCRYGEAADT